MTDTLLVEARAETLSNPAAHVAATDLRAELASRAIPPASAASVRAELVSRAVPPIQGVSLLAEACAEPLPPTEIGTLLIEVLRRDTAASAIVATGYDAFGDTPWPEADAGVFAFRHDWSQPLVERLEWRTHVAALASGNEARTPLRLVPRRTLRYSVGHGNVEDGLVADWLADHMGRRAWWPLPQHARVLAGFAPAGGLTLAVAASVASGPVAGTRPRFDHAGLSGWDDTAGWCWCASHAGWQVVRLVKDAHDPERLWLSDPLARDLPAGSMIYPLVQGVATESASFVQHVPGLMGGEVTASVSPPRPPWSSTNQMETADDPALDGLPVWPDANWDGNPGLTASALLHTFDGGFADPWIRRATPVRGFTLERRHLIDGAAEMNVWLKRLWQVRGRHGAFWLPDAAAPGMTTTHEALPDDGYIRVANQSASAFMHRPAACRLQLPSGEVWHVLISGAHREADGTAVLLLGGELPDTLPEGSRVQRLLRCRLTHDAVEFIWHTDSIVELPLTAQTLPDPRGQLVEGGF